MKKLLAFSSVVLFASYALGAGAPINPVFGNADAGNLNVNGLANVTQLQVRGADVTTVHNYLIPEFGASTVYEHVNATDLENGTAKVGMNFRDGGLPVYSASSPVAPAESAFSSSTFFSQDAGSSLASLGAGPWVGALLVSAPATTTNLFMLVGTLSTNGYYVQAAGANVSFLNAIGGGPTTSGGFVYGIGTINLVMFGMDGAGNQWVQVNGGTAANTTGTITAGATSVNLGGNTGYPWPGAISELMFSNATPSQAFFNSMWAAVAPRVGTPGTYESGADGGTPALTPAFIEHGSLQLSGATNVCHAFNRTYTATPDCVVGLGRGAPTVSGAPSFDAGVAGICVFESTTTTAEVTYQCIGN